MSTIRFAVPVLAVLVAAPLARADLQILVTPSLGPNESPSYNVYRNNSLVALESGAPTEGTQNTPAYYQAIPSGGSVLLNHLVVTDFTSWLGRANPKAEFGPQYEFETGTRLYFGIAIRPDAASLLAGTNTQFSISQLSFRGTTTDPNKVLDFGFGAGEYEYSEDYVGLLLNKDGTVRKRITSGPNDQLVDALIGRGSSNAFEALAQPGLTNQDAIDQALPTAGFKFTGRYDLTYSDRAGNPRNATGEETVSVVPVPEPSTTATLGLGLACLSLFRRFRR